MYTSLLVLVIAITLISANALIGLPMVLGLSVILINRVDREEAVMIEEFGDEYREYMKRTGRLLPRLVS